MDSLSKVFLPGLFVILWSSGWVSSKYAMEWSGPFTFLTLRYVLVVLVLLSWVLVFNHWRKIDGKSLACHALVGILSHAVFIASSMMAMERGASAGMVALVTAMQPMLTAAVCGLFTREQVSVRQWVGLSLGLIAVLLVIGDRIVVGGSVAAYGLPLLSVLAITIATLLSRRIELRDQAIQKNAVPLSLIMLIHCGSALLVFASIGIVREGLDVQWNSTLILTLIYSALVVSIGSFTLMFLLLRRMPVIKVACLGYLTPPVTMLGGWYLLNEFVTAIDITGLILAGLAIYLVNSESLAKNLRASKTGVFVQRPLYKVPARGAGSSRAFGPTFVDRFQTNDKWARELAVNQTSLCER